MIFVQGNYWFCGRKSSPRLLTCHDNNLSELLKYIWYALNISAARPEVWDQAGLTPEQKVSRNRHGCRRPSPCRSRSPGAPAPWNAPPRPPPGKINLLLSGPLTAHHGHGRGHPRERGRGNLATRPGVSRNHPYPPRCRHGPRPTPTATRPDFGF